MMYFISGCKGTQIVLQGNVIHVTEVLQNKFSIYPGSSIFDLRSS
ncbi:hypothetical protein SAMN05444350_1265 [Bacteroides stercorirosoris]|jgi:hypothetical protein|uniref:Uncharacterized protein n=1 Tax=Bacteroides stercorirosoris TaxID=871324 RepID=A0A1M6J0D5_9BACE|nr:hypothetical protein SAMN05444350_1265 [Bacteroides stercorirosoris]